MSHSILTAARRCYLRLGVHKTTMADIASEAGISRATLYRRFANRDEIFVEVLSIESDEMAADSVRVLEGVTEPAERVVEGILFCIAEVPKRPLHHHFFTGESATWSAHQTLGSDALRRISRSLLGLSLQTDEGLVADPTFLDDLAEWVLRILVSFVTIPSSRCPDPESLRRMLRSLLAPAVQAAVDSKGESP
ncbi:MAG: hypothetical protein CL908_27015 [Deltaproteobacteria bacterium]|jgi:AcrR family transcriptional regulator|nr:hypothetical protein [Deltaproteobacteria bacterium]